MTGNYICAVDLSSIIGKEIVKKKLLMCIILLVVITGIPTAGAAPSQAPFITIDPIGNHTVGDIFFINGTTNLGHWENTLDLDIEWWAFNPAGRWSSMYITNASIRPVGNGTGHWSAEVLPAQWEMYTDVEHRTTVFRDADPGEYVAYAESTSPLGPAVISQQTFFLVPGENNVTPEMPDTTAVPGTNDTETPSSPIPAASPFAGIAAVVIVRSLYRRKL